MLGCFLLSVALGQHAWKLRYFSDKASVGFLVELNRQRHVRLREYGLVSMVL